MYDVIVVGARCAGAPTAMLLARAGYRVLLLDRAHFPSDTLSTHYLHLPAVRQLAEWKVLDQLLATGCPPMRHTIYSVTDASGEEVRLAGSAPPLDGYDAAYAPRRHILDTLLIHAAIDAGAEFRENCTVTGLLRDDSGRVTGVRFRTVGQTRELTEYASLVVGADGKRSTIARLARAQDTVRDPLMTCVYYSYWEKVQVDFELYEGPGRWVGALRTHDATVVVAYFPQAEFPIVRTDAQQAYLDNVRHTAPDLYERMRGGRQVERLYGTGDQQNFFRQAHGPGWVLIGDAGHHKDSITARGITDAFQQAQLLVDCLGDTLQDRPRLDKALHDFAERRDAMLHPVYHGTIVVAQLTVQADRFALLRLISQDQALTNRYHATVAGTVSVEDLYTPELLAQL